MLAFRRLIQGFSGARRGTPTVPAAVVVGPNVRWDEFLRRCRRVEELGFDRISFGDHFTDWPGYKGPWLELWATVCAVAMATTRVRLAALVAQIPFRNPALFALQALSADRIAGGRLDLGLGIGLEIDPSYRMMVIENWSANERVARFGEYVDIVDRPLTQEEASYTGRFYRIDRAALCPRPVQLPRPPLIIAALGPVMIGHAARRADIWNTMSFAATFEEQIEETRARVATIDARCAAIGRDPSSLRRSIFIIGERPDPRTPQYYESEEILTHMAHAAWMAVIAPGACLPARKTRSGRQVTGRGGSRSVSPCPQPPTPALPGSGRNSLTIAHNHVNGAS